MNMSKDFRLKEGESDYQFIYRVYKFRDDIGGITKDEAGDICNRELKQNNHESSYRKMYQNFKNMFDAVRDQFEDMSVYDNTMTDIEDKMDVLYKEKKKYQDKIREYRKLLSDESRIENLKDTIEQAAKTVSEVHPFKYNKRYTLPKRKDGIMVVGLSDFHVGEEFEHFLGSGNIEKFRSSITKATEQIIIRAKKENVQHLCVLNMGDWISGNIRVSARVTNEEDVITQTMIVSETICNMLMELATSDQFDSITFHSVSDNHSRVTANKNEHIEKESFGRIIPWYLEARLSNIKNVKICNNYINGISEATIGICPLFDQELFFVHGHLDKPNRVIQDLTMMTKRFPVDVWYAHMHHNFESEVHSVDLIGCPSSVGTNGYAKEIRRTAKPRQKMAVYRQDPDGTIYRDGTFFIRM